VRTVGQRYRGKIRCWEPWNESDYGGFFNGGPSAMLPLAKIAYEALKAIDPANMVLTPNVTRAGLGWLDAYLAAGGGQYADVISFHRYPSPEPESDVPEYAAFQALAAAHGLADKPLWNTEGAVDHRVAAGDEVGAVARAWLVPWCQGVTLFAWYCWDIHWPDGPALGTSLTGPELSPAGRGLARLVTWVDGWTMTERVVSDEVWQVTLRRGENTRHLAWRRRGRAAWPPPPAWGRVRAEGLDGQPIAIGPDGLSLGAEPVLLVPTG